MGGSFRYVTQTDTVGLKKGGGGVRHLTENNNN
jgi:hypothetical protein